MTTLFRLPLDKDTLLAANDTNVGLLDSHPLPRAEELREQQSVTMTLLAQPSSVEAITAVTDIVQLVRTNRGRPRRPSSKYIMAIGTIIADTLKGASYTPLRPCYRPMAPCKFTSKPIGRDPFKRALSDLAAQQLVRVYEGKQGFRDEPSVVTRISATVRLTDYLAGYGIRALDCRNHFYYPREAEYVEPIQLRATSKRKGKNKLQGKRLKVDWHNPEVKRQAARMREINAYIASHSVTGPEAGNLDEITLTRIFNQGDQPGHNYRQGGRIYVHGGGYQGLKHRELGQRSLIKFDGEDTVEVDISACFLTIVYSLLGMALPPSPDPYKGPKLPRPIVKAWMNMTWSNPTFHRNWPEEVVNELEDENAKESFFAIRKTFPIKKVRDAIRATFPVVDAWMESSFTWADLHYKESEIMLEVMETLAFKHNVLSLPVHDSIRVPLSKTKLVKEVIESIFLKHTGFKPILTIKN